MNRTLREISTKLRAAGQADPSFADVVQDIPTESVTVYRLTSDPIGEEPYRRLVPPGIVLKFAPALLSAAESIRLQKQFEVGWGELAQVGTKLTLVALEGYGGRLLVHYDPRSAAPSFEILRSLQSVKLDDPVYDSDRVAYVLDRDGVDPLATSRSNIADPFYGDMQIQEP